MLSKIVSSTRASSLFSVRVVNSSPASAPRSRPILRAISVTRPLREVEKLVSDEGFSSLLKGIKAPEIRPEALDMIRLGDFPRPRENDARASRPRFQKKRFPDSTSNPEIPLEKLDFRRPRAPERRNFDSNNAERSPEDNAYRNQVKPRVSVDRLIEGEDVNTIRLASIIRNYGIKHNLPDAIRTFEEAKVQHPERINVYTITALISACVRSKDMAAAETFLAEMKNLNLEPNVVTYNNLIAGYSRIKKFDKALAAYQTLKDKGLVPDENTYSYVLGIYAEMGDKDKINELEKQLSEVKFAQPTQDLKNKLTRAAALGRVEDALRAFEDLRSAGALDWFVFKHVFKAFVTSGDYSRAPEIYDEAMKVKGLRLGTYESNAVLQGYINAGDMVTAEKIFNGMQFVGNFRNVYTFNTMIAAWSRLGRPEKAIECILEMQKGGIKFDDASFTILVQGLAKSNNLAQLEDLYEEVTKSGIVPSSLFVSSIINAFVDSNDLKRAEKFFDLAMTFPKVKASPEAYNSILKYWSRDRNLLKLTEIYDLMKANGARPDISTFNTLITGAHDKSEPARKFFNELKESGLEINSATYSTYMTVLGRAKDVVNLQPIVDSLIDSENRIIQNTILTVLAQNNLFDQCLAFFHAKMVKRGIPMDLFIAQRVAPCLIATGKTAEAFKLMDDFKERGHVLDFIFFRHVAIALERVKDWPSLVRLVEETMKKFGVKPVEAVNAYYSTALRNVNRKMASKGA